MAKNAKKQALLDKTLGNQSFAQLQKAFSVGDIQVTQENAQKIAYAFRHKHQPKLLEKRRIPIEFRFGSANAEVAVANKFPEQLLLFIS